MKNISKKIFKKYFLVVVTMLNGLLKICQLLKKPKTNKMAYIDKENVRIFTENGKLVRLELKLNGKIVFTLEENKDGVVNISGINTRNFTKSRRDWWKIYNLLTEVNHWNDILNDHGDLVCDIEEWLTYINFKYFFKPKDAYRHMTSCKYESSDKGPHGQPPPGSGGCSQPCALIAAMDEVQAKEVLLYSIRVHTNTIKAMKTSQQRSSRMRAKLARKKAKTNFVFNHVKKVKATVHES